MSATCDKQIVIGEVKSHPCIKGRRSLGDNEEENLPLTQKVSMSSRGREKRQKTRYDAVEEWIGGFARGDIVTTRYKSS